MMQGFLVFAEQAWVLWMSGLFLIICLRVLWPGNKARWEAFGRIPLDDDDDDAAAAATARPVPRSADDDGKG